MGMLLSCTKIEGVFEEEGRKKGENNIPAIIIRT